MKIYCIVVTFNGEKWISKCFGSLRNSSIPLEIIAIDNGSTDDTVTYIRNNFPQVKIIETGKNLGFGQANNIGLKIALTENADYVFLLNQDAWVEPLSIKNLIDAAIQNPEYGILSPIHLSGSGNALEYKFKEYLQQPFSEGFISDLYLNTLKPLYETSFVNAAAWLISRTCLETVGGFDPIFFHYGEDVDYIQRARYFNYKIGIVPTVKIWHDSKFIEWNQIKIDNNRMLTIYVSEVKSVYGSLRSNALVFFKRRFDEFSSNLLYRRFKFISHDIKFSWKIGRMLHKISRARKLSKVKGAFLK